MTTFYALLGILVVFVAGALLSDLGAGHVPQPIRPLANIWARAGYDPKWISVATWALFALMAGLFVLLVGIPLYYAVIDLGTPRH